MKTSIEKIDKVLSLISYAGAYLGAIAVTIMTVFITLNVIVRKVTDFSFIFVEEYSGYALVLIVYFGLAHALRSKKHISMELVFQHLPRRIQSIVAFITTSCCIIILCYLIYKSINYAIFSIQMGVRSDWLSQSILWPFHMLIPIGLLMFLGELIRYYLVKKISQ